jgi:hypothetical protein
MLRSQAGQIRPACLRARDTAAARTEEDVAVSEPVALLVDEEELVAVLLGVADAESEPVAV